MTQRTMPGEAGYALAVATIMAFAVGVIGFSFLAMGGHETKASQKQLDSQRAFWLAEAGRGRALLWMTEQMRPPEAEVTIYQDASGPDGGSYTVHCLVDTAAAYQVEKAFVLDCCGRSRGLERRIRQRIRMTSFARYAYFTHDEVSPGGSSIWYITADVIDGRLHSNGTLRIAGSPRFLGEVTSASDHMIGYPSYWVSDPADWPVGGNDPDFAAGATLAVPEIPLPTETLDLRQEALTGGIHVATETDVEIGVAGDPPVAAPGWLRYRSRTPPGQPWVSASVASLASGVLYGNQDLHISGVLSGELTIAARGDIWIEDDLRYLGSDAQGAPLPGCTDMLGCIAEGNIIFADNAANRNDLVVNAVLMALDTSITAQNYSTGAPRGTLTIWGGLIQKYRGPVGTFSGGAITTGYRKDYHYDTRVTARTPPAFPLTGVYEQVAWLETWDDSYPF